MTLRFASVARLLVTTLAVALAVVIGWQLWKYYAEAPWTRDGRVRADVAQIAPDVSGLVTEIRVHDNEFAHKGDVLFQIDPQRDVLALQEAEATVASRQATAEQSERDAQRALSLNATAISRAQQEQTVSSAAIARAAAQQAIAARDVARLNVARTQVVAPVNGVLTNVEMRPGDYVTVGKAVMAQVDSDSFYISGYFEETKLPRIQVGDKVAVRLLGERADIEGHVDSVARGIVDRELATSSSLLANVNPTFSWVRLAQRIPVRIALDHVPDGVMLISGRTATVTVLPDKTAARQAAR
jgi:multidrug resistance efflux pump